MPLPSVRTLRYADLRWQDTAVKYRSRAIILIACWESYATGGARRGPRARGASPSGSALSRTGSVSTIFAMATRASLNKGPGADACRNNRAIWEPGAWRR